MTTNEDAKDLNKFENDLEIEFKGLVNYCYVGRVTWNGYREIIYYIDDPEKLVKKLQEAIDNHKFRNFAFRCEKDEEWKNVSIYFKD